MRAVYGAVDGERCKEQSMQSDGENSATRATTNAGSGDMPRDQPSAHSMPALTIQHESLF